MTITLPEALNQRLLEEAKTRKTEVEEVALDILREALFSPVDTSDVETIVKEIQAAGPSRMRPANGSLADALRNALTIQVLTWRSGLSSGVLLKQRCALSQDKTMRPKVDGRHGAICT